MMTSDKQAFLTEALCLNVCNASHLAALAPLGFEEVSRVLLELSASLQHVDPAIPARMAELRRKALKPFTTETMVPLSCSECGQQFTEVTYEDYASGLSVAALCEPCNESYLKEMTK